MKKLALHHSQVAAAGHVSCHVTWADEFRRVAACAAVRAGALSVLARGRCGMDRLDALDLCCIGIYRREEDDSH